MSEGERQLAPGEMDARVAAYALAVAIEHVVFCATHAVSGGEAAREKFTDAAWPLFLRKK